MLLPPKWQCKLALPIKVAPARQYPIFLSRWTTLTKRYAGSKKPRFHWSMVLSGNHGVFDASMSGIHLADSLMFSNMSNAGMPSPGGLPADEFNTASSRGDLTGRSSRRPQASLAGALPTSCSGAAYLGRLAL